MNAFFKRIYYDSRILGCLAGRLAKHESDSNWEQSVKSILGYIEARASKLAAKSKYSLRPHFLLTNTYICC